MATPHPDAGRLAGLRVALVFPNFLAVELASYQDNGRFLGTVPPLSLLYVASVLERAGADVVVLDCIAEGIGLDGALDRLRAFEPDYVGFTLTTVDWLSSSGWMQKVHEVLGVPVLVGGIHMECYPEETLTHAYITLGYVGQADQSLVQLLETHHGGGDLSAVPGSVFRRDDGSVCSVPPDRQPRDDAGLPFPARNLIPNERYFTIVSTEQNFTAAMSNFGCPFGCEFCILRVSPLRHRSAESVVDEMEVCYREFGIREIDFFDPVFTIRKDRVHKICDEIKRRNMPGLIWSIRARTDTIDVGLLDRMWDAGCRRIYYGIESGNPEIRRRVNKRMVSNEHIVRVLQATHERGFEILAFVMIGNPMEDRSTVRETRALLKQAPIDLVQVASLFPLPRTPIYNQIVAHTGRDFWREHVLTGASVHPVTRLDTALDDEQIRRLVTETYVSFYFRPTFALYALKRARHPVHLRRGVDAAVGIGKTFFQEVRGGDRLPAVLMDRIGRGAARVERALAGREG